MTNLPIKFTPTTDALAIIGGLVSVRQFHGIKCPSCGKEAACFSGVKGSKFVAALKCTCGFDMLGEKEGGETYQMDLLTNQRMFEHEFGREYSKIKLLDYKQPEPISLLGYKENKKKLKDK